MPVLLAAEVWARSVVEPLTWVIDEQRRNLEAKSEWIGYLPASVDQARARLAELTRLPEPAHDPFLQPLPPTPNIPPAPPGWRRWLPGLASAGLGLVVGGSSWGPW
ncbi:MAG: hypothetical protein M3O34_13495 [Chloroflexota bacterium]|nr:hypothetical protein [Chloroflexota bacterium]